tara:strand:+ start:78 stop:395 length:318 start_codon:yes stop_codon:yes gene_type:complete
MSSVPKVDKPKYNQNKPYEWVDSQWEKLMTKQKELEDEIVNLTGKIKNDMDYIRMLEESLKESKENFRRLERLHKFGTPTDGLEVGSPEDYEISNQLEIPFDEKA